MLADARNACFQADPFATVKNDVHPILVFKEKPAATTNQWVADGQSSQSKGVGIKDKHALCSSSLMGTRCEGAFFLNCAHMMVQEFDAPRVHAEKCRSDNIFDDQLTHNCARCADKSPGAFVIPHHAGPTHNVGEEADEIFRKKETEKAMLRKQGKRVKRNQSIRSTCVAAFAGQMKIDANGCSPRLHLGQEWINNQPWQIPFTGGASDRLFWPCISWILAWVHGEAME
jgi:hypothetical protein